VWGPTLLKVAQAAPPHSREITEVLANPSDWRAIAGLLALLWVITLAALLRERSVSRADAKAKDEWVERTAAGVNEALKQNAEAKSETAAALQSLASAQQGWVNTMARVEAQLGRRTK
jgi:hypothetical protein